MRSVNKGNPWTRCRRNQVIATVFASAAALSFKELLPSTNHNNTPRFTPVKDRTLMFNGTALILSKL